MCASNNDTINAVLSLPPLKEVIAAHNLRAEKSLGQNFLLDLNITDKIARIAFDSLSSPQETHFFEIGPGPGGLTRSLLKLGSKGVIAIEFDERAIHALKSLEAAAAGTLSLIHGDALEKNLLELGAAPRSIAANLPYNIATPLTIGWLSQIRDHGTRAFVSMHLMYQKEVAQRIVAKPASKAYGRLAVIAQWLCHTRIVYDLPPSAFTPPPKVDSAVVQFIPKTLDDKQPSFKTVETITAKAFGQRRKMIRQSLKDYSALFQKAGLEETARAETLSVEQFVRLAMLAEQTDL